MYFPEKKYIFCLSYKNENFHRCFNVPHFHFRSFRCNFLLFLFLRELFLWYFLCRAQLSLYYVTEGRDSHRIQYWLYQKRYILFLFFFMLEDFDWCVNVMRLPIKRRTKVDNN